MFNVGNTSLAGFRIPIKGAYFPVEILIFLSLDHFDSNNFNTRDQPVNSSSLRDNYPQHIYYLTTLILIFLSLWLITKSLEIQDQQLHNFSNSIGSSDHEASLI